MAVGSFFPVYGHRFCGFVTPSQDRVQVVVRDSHGVHVSAVQTRDLLAGGKVERPVTWLDSSAAVAASGVFGPYPSRGLSPDGGRVSNREPVGGGVGRGVETSTEVAPSWGSLKSKHVQKPLDRQRRSWYMNNSIGASTKRGRW